MRDEAEGKWHKVVIIAVVIWLLIVFGVIGNISAM